MKELLVATGNPGKLAEYQDLLAGLPVQWRSLRDVGLADMEVEETGSSFMENAYLKAAAYGAAAGLPTLADDSGLVVDALNGAPGIYSARYGAPTVNSDQGRYEKLLAALEGVPDAERSARFVCAVAIYVPGQPIQGVEGHFEGAIAHSPRGSYGFGYDPVFLLADGRSLAELPPQEKHAVSHRGIALRQAEPLLRHLLALE